MLKRTRSQTRLLSSNTNYRSKPASDDSDQSDSDSKENLPSPPSTPSKRLRGSPPTTPKNVRHITKELQRTKVVVSPTKAATTTTTTAQSTTSTPYPKKSTVTKEKPATTATDKEENIYQKAKTVFRRTAAPSRLIGRTQERERMRKFWNDHVLGNKPGCLYVSGSPGTGKTAMLTEIMRSHEDDISALGSHKVKEVMINCMSIREPKGIYTKLVTELKTARQAMQTDVVKQAEQLLNGKKNVLNVVILDEIDHLITRDQDVLYKIFEWASSPASRLVLIGIANALDLTDRLLPRLRTKNCEPQLLNFNPYKVPEISAIIKDRLYSLDADPTAPKEGAPLPLMQPNAVELCARKVAASMGDLRTALDVCRRAIELAEADWKRKNQQQKPVLGEQKNDATPQPQPKNADIVKVAIPHVMKVLQSVFGSPAVQKLKQLNLQQKVVMGVLMVMMRNAKKEQITLGRFRESYATLCSKSSMITPVSGTELVDLLSNIETAGILTVGKSKEDRSRRIHLNVQDSEIVQMIQEVSVLNSWMETVVSCQAK